LLVKVIARMFLRPFQGIDFERSSWMKRCLSAVVLPDPAEAETTVYFGRSSAKSWSFSRMVDIGERIDSRTI